MDQRFRIILILLGISVLALPAGFFSLFIFDIGSRGDAFISARDGSVGPAFFNWLKATGVILMLIWGLPLLYWLIKHSIKKSSKN